MGRIIFVSNLLPLKIVKARNGKINLQQRIGGYSSGLTKFYQDNHTAWIGTTGIDKSKLQASEKEKIGEELMKHNCYPIYLKKRVREKYLEGYCNTTLWSLFHYFNELATYRKEDWKAYVAVNEIYAEHLEPIIKEDDSVWIHDYHLMLLPRMLRERFPTLSIGYFQHIPFPSFEVFRLLPQRIEILEGLLGADLIGFHTYDYERHFMSSVRRLIGLDTYLNQIRYDKRVLKVENFPMGIDFDKFHNTARELMKKTPAGLRDFKEQIKNHIKVNEENKIILSIDWLDFSKGIINRLKTYRNFLQNYKVYRGKVTLLLYVTPPNENISEYKKIKSELDEQVGKINAEFGRINWRPVYYFYEELSFEQLVQVYQCSDVALITPIRDGMNLIAKEYIASHPEMEGVLILSEMAGASKEMAEAIIVNPNNKAETAHAIHQALSMPPEEKRERNSALQQRLSRYTEYKWATDFIKSLDGVKQIQEYNATRRLSRNLKNKIIQHYNKAESRLILLDYDGTLQGFYKDPQDARPDKELYDLLNQIIADISNRVIIISGRDKETLSEWFDRDWRIGFIAEHGVWHREPDSDWHMIEPINKSWMDEIRNILTFYVDRTPRSFIEEKNYSLVWHYRNSDPDLGIQRSYELKDELQSLVSNLHLEIMDGDKVIEIKNSGINKGRAALHRMGEESYDFILALGDDWTDEFTFESMPPEAITVKVGTKSTKAKYFVENHKQVRELLKLLTSCP